MQTRRSPDPLSDVLSALSDPIRRAIVERLSRGPATVGELRAPFSVSAPAISRHLRVLESAGLLKREIVGREHWCSLVVEPLDEIDDFVRRTRGFWESKLDQLAAYVEE